MELPDDRPLTIADTTERGHGIGLLAERLAQHLGEGWTARTGGGTVLLGPYEEALWLRHAFTSDTSGGHALVVELQVPGKTARVHRHRFNLFLLPSALAEQIRTEVLPGYRNRIKAAREAEAAIAAAEDARSGHARAVADRLGGDWTAERGTYGAKAIRPQKKTRVYGHICWDDNGRMRLNLNNLTPETIERIVDALVDHIDRHEIPGSASVRKRPKRLNHLLELMVAAGYRIDRLGEEHKALFGAYLFKMDMRAAPGDDLVGYLFGHPDVIDRAISYLTKEDDERT